MHVTLLPGAPPYRCPPTLLQALMQVPLGLAEAFATAMLTAQKASVAGAGAANASAVADVFVAGLQDAALACTEEHRPAAAPHTEAYFQCGPVSPSYQIELTLTRSSTCMSSKVSGADLPDHYMG